MTAQTLAEPEVAAVSEAVDDLVTVCIATKGDKNAAESAISGLSGYETSGPGIAVAGSGRSTFLLLGADENYSCVFAYDPNVGAEDTSIDANVERLVSTLDIMRSELATRLAIAESDFVEEQGSLTYTSENLQIMILPRSSIRFGVTYSK